MANKISSYIDDVRTEMKKVNWLSKDELMGSTGVVAIFSVIMGCFLFVASDFWCTGGVYIGKSVCSRILVVTHSFKYSMDTSFFWCSQAPGRHDNNSFAMVLCGWYDIFLFIS